MKLIRGAALYAPEYLGKKDVLIAGGRIEAIRDHIDLPEELCEVIHGEGKIMTPGLIDCHVHITGGGGEGSFHTKAPEVNLSALLKGGITTVLGLLGTDGISRSVENLLSKTKALKEEGISCYMLCGSYGYPSVTITGSVGRDIAFLEECIGCKLAISDHRAPNITTQELIRLASDVRTAAMLSGKAGILTLHMGDDKRGLEPVFEALASTSIPIKTFHPTHVGRNDLLFEHAVRFAKMGGFIDLTTGSEHVPITGRLRQAKAAGVPTDRITMSSDGQGSWSNYDEEGHLLEIGVSSVESLHKELITLVADGVELPEALSYMTSNVAASLELPQKGHLREGADADLLLMQPDLSLDTVIAMGRTMMQDGKLQVWGTYEPKNP